MTHPPPVSGAAAALAAVRQAQHDQRAAEVAQLEHILEFARHYRLINAELSPPMVAGTEQLVDFGGDGTPRLAEFCVLELAAALGVAEHVAFVLIGDVLDLAYRHRELWRLVRSCELPVWIARKLVRLTSPLNCEQAHQVDAQLAATAVGLSPGRLFKLTEALVLEAQDSEEVTAAHEQALRKRGVWFDSSRHGLTSMGANLNAVDALFLDAQLDRLAQILAAGGDDSPGQVLRAKALGLLSNPARSLQLIQASLLDQPAPELPDAECPAAGQRGHSCGTIDVEPDKLLPRAQLVVHLTDQTLATGNGIARAEQLGPVLAGWVRELTQHTRVSVRPVLKVDALQPSDAYEVPAAMREAITLRNPVSVFPYASRPSAGLDLDHTEPFQHDGTPGQSHPGNLGPVTRRAHRAKTHGGWLVSQPVPGTFIWSSPLGYSYLVTPSHSWLIHDPAIAASA